MADKNDKNNTDNVSQFPDEIERLKRLEQKLKAEKSKQKPPSEPVLNIPTGVKWMSVVFIGAFLITYFANTDIANTLFRYLAFLPPLYENPSQGPFYLLATMPFTHTLLHGGWFHLAINVAMLLAFGSAVEKYIGTKRLIIRSFHNHVAFRLCVTLSRVENQLAENKRVICRSNLQSKARCPKFQRTRLNVTQH